MTPTVTVEAGAPWSVRRLLGVPLALALVTGLAAIDVTAGPGTVLAGLMVVGPAMASIAASARGVLGVGCYTIAVILTLATRDDLWGTVELAYFLGAAVAVTALSGFTASLRERLAVEAVTAAAASQRIAARKTAILTCALDALVTIDGMGKVLEVNPAMCAMFGWTDEEMVGRDLADLIVPEGSRQSHRDGLATFRRTGQSPMVGARLEVTAVRKDGTPFPAEVTITRVDLPGELAFTGSIRDLAATKAAQEEADQLRDRLRQTDRLDSLGELAGGIAHDFNNSLAVIVNYAGLARQELPDGQVADDVDAISAAVGRAADLTRQLLTFSRGDQRGLGVTNPNMVSTQVCEVLRRTFPATIAVVCKLDGTAWPVQCDTTRLDQVLMNLALNARDAMPDGGTLTVETSNERLDELAASNRVSLGPGRYLCLTVSDTGTGMSREVKGRAFDPFFTTKTHGHGTGLGLATVYGIVKQMGGEVSIYSELGHGTTIRLHLPAVSAATTRTESAAQPLVPSVIGTPRVLLVEDEDLLRRALNRTLSKAGYVVQAAGSAEEAATLMASVMPDLLISDVSLPGLDGFAFALQLRSVDPMLPVLLMSGYAPRQLPDGLADSVVLLDKPFATNVLLANVSQLVAGIGVGSTTGRAVGGDRAVPLDRA